MGAACAVAGELNDGNGTDPYGLDVMVGCVTVKELGLGKLKPAPYVEDDENIEG